MEDSELLNSEARDAQFDCVSNNAASSEVNVELKDEESWLSEATREDWLNPTLEALLSLRRLSGEKILSNPSLPAK